MFPATNLTSHSQNALLRPGRRLLWAPRERSPSRTECGLLGFGRVEVGVACKIREDGASRNSEAGSLNCCALLFTSAHWQRKGVLSH